jgi:putative oxidoreductase
VALVSAARAVILGVFTLIAGILNIVGLLGAIVLVHAENGVFVENGGFELVLALFAGLIVIALLGAGKFSIDGIIGRTRSGAVTAHR